MTYLFLAKSKAYKANHEMPASNGDPKNDNQDAHSIMTIKKTDYSR
jgi:hypothetical protein